MSTSITKICQPVQNTGAVQSIDELIHREGTLQRAARNLLFLVALFGWSASFGQTGNLDQARNGGAGSPTSPVSWVNGNAGSSNSHYLESMSVPYRYVVTGLSAGSHTFVIEYDIKKGSSHALDYLTHFNHLEPHAQFSHPAEVVDPLAGISGLNTTPITYPIPQPPTNKVVSCTGISQPATSFNALPAQDRVMTMYNGSAITNIQYLNAPDLNQSDGSQQVQVTFTTTNPTVVFAWGGHIASATDWCPQYSAAGISGSPYHMRVISLDGSGGNMDRSLSAAAVIPVPPCGITGIVNACPSQVASYSIDPYTGYSYTWSIINNTSGASFPAGNTGSSVNVNTGTGTGGFTIRVTMSITGYTGTCTKDILVKKPLLTENHTDYACGNSAGSINLSVSGGFPPYSYQWNSGQTTEDISGLAAGNYSVAVTDQAGCASTLSATINALTALSAGTTTTPVSCHGGNNGAVSASVSGGGGPYAFLWSNGSTLQNLSGLAAGTYTLTVTDNNGCTKTVSASVGQPALALTGTVSASSAVSCFGGNNGAIDVSVSGGTQPYAYSWSNGAASQDLPAVAAGSYTLTITDANGCTFSLAGLVVSQPAASLSAEANASGNVSCFGGSDGFIDLTAAGGTPPYAYSWSNGATSEDLENVPSGSYTVSVTDANGCSVQLNALYIAQPAASLSASVASTNNVHCFGGNDGNISLSVSGGTAPYGYNWSNGATIQNLNSIPAGSYSVTITDANGCVATASGITVSQPAAALATSQNTTQVNCYGAQTGAIDLSVSGGTPPYAYQWNTGDNSQDLNNVPSGSYTVTVTDANGCTSLMAAIVIAQPSAPLSGTASTTQNVSCNSGANGAISLAVSGGTPGYTFVWSNGATTQSISSLFAGTYVVTITDGNGCIANTSSTVSQPAGSLNSSVSATQSVSCHGGSNGSMSLAVTGGTTPYSYAWSNGATTQNVSNLSAGTYTVTISDANGCLNVLSGIIGQPAAALSASVSAASDVSCHGGTNGSIDLTISGGTTPYTYNWNNGASTQDLFGLAAGSYSVLVTDANGCTIAQSAITISQPAAALSGTASAVANVSCFGNNDGSIALNVSGGTSPYSYLWNNGMATQNMAGLAAGTYSVVITDANGCTANAQATVSQPAASLAATATASQQVSCFGGANGAINLTVSGGTVPYAYQWNNNATSEDLSGLPAGTYMVTITDANGCTFGLNQSVTQPAGALAITLNTSQNVSCFGGANGAIDLTASMGTPPYSYNWSNGSASEDLTGLAAGTYTVTVTDANGCTLVKSTTVSQPVGALSASASASQNVSCFGGDNGVIDLTVTQGTPPYAFSWNTGDVTEDLSGLAAGAYSVVITDANGCTAAASATVSQPAGALVANTATTQQVSCYAGNNGAIDLTVTYGTAPYSFNWSNGASSEDLSGLAAGTYTVTVTDANGCTIAATGTISQPAAALQANISSAQDVSCYGGSNGLLDLTATGGTYPYTFAWSNGASTEDLTGLQAGNYSVLVTDANGCTFTLSASIQQPAAALSSGASVTSNISCFAGNNGSIDLTVAGGTAPYSFLWNTGAVTEDLTGLSAGSYTVTVTDDQGCTSVSSAIIEQPAGALATSVSVTQQVSCFGGANGSVNLTVNGGTPPYSYAWSNGATTEDLSGLPAGTYSVNIIDVNGCNASASASITQPAGALDAGANVFQEVNCFGGNDGSIDLVVTDGTAPYSYNWSNGETTQDIDNLSAGTYTVTVTDANGCQATATAVVSQPAAALQANASTSQNVNCFAGSDGSVDLIVTDGTPPYNFLWNNGQTTQQIANLPAGTYMVTVTDANGCVISASATVGQPAAALNAFAAVSQNVNCFAGNDGSIDLTVLDGTAPYTYAWNNGETTEDIGGLAAGTYTVLVTDANGCTLVESATVSQPAAQLNAFAAVTQNVSCFAGNNGSIDLTVLDGTAPYTFLWSTGDTLQNLSGLAAGSYSVTVTDANGCVVTESANISQPAASLSANVVVTANISCFSGNNGSIDLTVSGGTPPYAFAWNTGDTTEDVSGLAAGSYSVSITDVNGCTTNATATITQPVGSLSASAAVTQQVNCFAGNDGSVDLTVTDGTAPYSFLWSNGATTEDLSGLAAGTYTVTVTDANGCITNVSIAVTQPAAALNASAVASQQVNCFAGNDGSVDLTVADGTAPYTFLWSNGATTEDLSGLAAGTYTVTVTDANGCAVTASVTVTQPSASLAVSGNTTSSNCLYHIGGSVTISPAGGTGPYVYTWSNGSASQNLSGLSQGTYTVTITDANGCITSAAYVVSDLSEFNAAADGPNVLCAGDVASLVADSIDGVTYQWYLNGQALAGATSPVLVTPVAGTYTVSITGPCGKFDSQPIEIEVIQAPAITISDDVIICAGESKQLNASGGVSYQWTPSAGLDYDDVPNPIASPLTTTAYTVQVSNQEGCTATAQVLVTIECDTLIIPSGYSPNDDGINDAFVIKGIDHYPGNKIWIYNRWGNLIFKTSDYKNNWDGISNVSGIYIGKRVPAGTYFYVLDLNTGTKPLQGYIVLRY